MPAFEEELLEPVARLFRFRHALDQLPADKPIKIADLGCGPKLRLYHFLTDKNIRIGQFIGIDPLVNQSVIKAQQSTKVKIINKPLLKKIALESQSVDFVTAFAFFEHIDHPREILAEAYRILRPGGKIIITVPSPRAKLILEFLAFKLGLISRREIEEHKQYFDRESLFKILPKGVKRSQVTHRYFGL
ncbi:MAG: methyltransferase domain-containing protein, partial [Candidatus Paceibacterota bacterium]